MITISTKTLSQSNEFLISIGNFKYTRIADFSIDTDLLLKWGRKRLITEDIYGNCIVYWKERFPLFDAFDREFDGRHYRLMLFCTSLYEAQSKLNVLQNEELRITQFGQSKELIEALFQNQNTQLFPYVYCEDNIKLIVVE